MSMTANGFAKMLRGINPKVIQESKQEEFSEVASRVRDQVIENFYNEKDSTGNSWQPRKGNPKHLPLRLSWTMFAAATVKGAPGGMEIIMNDEILVGISGEIVKYASTHQFGSRNGKVPAREYYFVREDDLHKLEEPIEDALMRILDEQVIMARAA